MKKEEYEALSPEEKQKWKEHIIQTKYGGVAPTVGTPVQQSANQSLNSGTGASMPGQQYPPQANGFAQNQYGSDAYDLSMQNQGFANQSEYGQADYRNMYGNVPNQPFDDGSSLPITMEESEKDKKKRRKEKRKKESSVDGEEGKKSKILPIIAVILVLIIVVGGGALAVLKFGLLARFGIGAAPQQATNTEVVEPSQNSNASTSAESASPYDATFIGTWTLTGLKDDKTAYTKEEIANIAKDDEGYLLIFEDGKMEMSLIGNGSTLSGTWKALGETECEFDVGGTDRVSATCSDNVMSIQYKEQSIEFEKSSNTVSKKTSSGSNTNSSSSLLGGGNTSNTNATTNTATNTSTNTSASAGSNTSASAGSNTSANTNTAPPPASSGSSASSGGFVDVD